MKYYSDKTKKLYDSVELLNEAEMAYDEAHAAELKKAEQKKTAAEAIRAARKAIVDAQNKYNELVNQFIKDYGSYHETYRDGDVVSLRDIFNLYW
jgi:type IV secretory pathway VirB9-like protein